MSSRVIWITGLAGAGKTTLARALVEKRKEANPCVIFLDGDAMREALAANAGHTRDERRELAFVYGRLCRMLSSQGFEVVIATISMFAEVHEWNRRNLPSYVEVFLRVPRETLAQRDQKGLYGKEGRPANVAGVDMAVDEPSSPHILLDHSRPRSVEDDLHEILAYLKKGMR